MADIKISALPTAGPAADADVSAQVQSGVTVKQPNSAMLTYMQNKLTTPAQLVYMTNDGNDLAANGSALNPFLTYAAAVAYALSQGASAAKPFSIVPIGIFNITGDLSIYPYVNISGPGPTMSTFILTGGIINDSSWYTTNSAMTVIVGCSFTAPSGLSAVFNGGNGNTILHVNCDFANCASLFTSTNNTSTEGNLLVLQNIIEYDETVFGGGVTVLDTNLTVIGGALPDLTITATGASGSNGSGASVLGCELFGTTLIDSSTGTGSSAVLFANASQIYSSPLELKGANSIYGADAASYYTVPTFSSGASIANVQITSLSDSVAQTSFTPVNYTPTNNGGSSPWPITSDTANFAGIDAALASGSGVTITDDNSTNATMYPTWVTGNSGGQPVHVSSSEFQWNPSSNTLKILDSLGNYTSTNGLSTTQTLNDTEGFNPIFTEYATVATGSLFQAGILDGTRFGYDLYDSVTPKYVFYTDPYGEVGPGGAIHFQYSLIVDSTSPNQLLATDVNNVVISVPNIIPSINSFTLSVDGGNTSGAGSIINVFGTYEEIGDYVLLNTTINFVPSSTTPQIAFHAPLVGAGNFPIGIVVTATGSVFKDASPTTNDGAIALCANLAATDSILIPMVVTTTSVSYYVSLCIRYQFRNF